MAQSIEDQNPEGSYKDMVALEQRRLFSKQGILMSAEQSNRISDSHQNQIIAKMTELLATEGYSIEDLLPEKDPITGSLTFKINYIGFNNVKFKQFRFHKIDDEPEDDTKPLGFGDYYAQTRKTFLKVYSEAITSLNLKEEDISELDRDFGWRFFMSPISAPNQKLLVLRLPDEA